MLLSFLFHPFHISKMFLFEEFFHLDKWTKKLLRMRSDEWGGWGMGSCHFWSKTANTQCGKGRCACKSAIIKWANVLTKSFKKSLKLNAASQQHHQLVHWYGCVPVLQVARLPEKNSSSFCIPSHIPEWIIWQLCTSFFTSINWRLIRMSVLAILCLAYTGVR